MTHPALPALVALSLVLSACETPTRMPPSDSRGEAGAALSHPAGQLELALASGIYSCESGVRLEVERETRNLTNNRVRIDWNGHNYLLVRDWSYSGLPRFEDPSSGLVWIDLPWKGLLLDGRTNRPLANECRSI